jgi:small subunit ribosomal protein S16
VADSRHPTDGRFVETLGHYDPLEDPADVVIDEERVMKWLGEGIQMSDTVRSLLSREGVLKKWHEAKYGPVKEAKAETKPKAAVKPDEKPKSETKAKPKARKTTKKKKTGDE